MPSVVNDRWYFCTPKRRKVSDKMKVKAKADFRDRENDLRLRKSGEQFNVKNDRAEQLSGLGLVEILPDKVAEEKKG